MKISISNLAPENVKNFVFLGEAGCGKSELAINLAKLLLREGNLPVHMFDLDMTKPLFRSRDKAKDLEDQGIIFHFEEQFYDAPTSGGGVNVSLANKEQYSILDVGGDFIGARQIGAYAPFLNRDDTRIYYMINNYRPWSADIDHIDAVLGQTLGVSHLQLERIHIVANPNLGPSTSLDDVLWGYKQIDNMISPYKPIDFVCVEEGLCSGAEKALADKEVPILPITRNLAYPWDEK